MSKKEFICNKKCLNIFLVRPIGCQINHKNDLGPFYQDGGIGARVATPQTWI